MSECLLFYQLNNILGKENLLNIYEWYIFIDTVIYKVGLMAAFHGILLKIE